jgi:Lysyl oxidase
MSIGCRIRITFAAAIAVACVGSVALMLVPATANADHPLEPDLVTLELSQSDLVIDPVSKRKTLLRITNEVGNQGVGPLEVFPGAETPTCDGNTNLEDGRRAFQRIFTDFNDSDGEFDRGVDTESEASDAGCMQYHPAHAHWHVLDFAEYSLFDAKSGQPAATGTKAGFCLVDTGMPFPELPGFPGIGGYYEFAGCGSNPNTPPALEGISVGFSDIYSSSTPGQRINATGLDRGKYCLVSEADPSDLLTETDDANNASEALIKLNLQKEKVIELSASCPPG